MSLNPIFGLAFLLFGLSPEAYGWQLQRSDWGATSVAVTHSGDTWVITGRKNSFTLNQSDLSIRVQAGAASWSMTPSSRGDMLVKTRGEEYPLRIADAQRISITRFDTGFKTGVRINLAGWLRPTALKSDPAPDVSLTLTICLDGRDEEIVFEASAVEHETTLRQLDWPGALDARDVDYTLLSNGRGTLLPRNWSKEYFPIRTITAEGKIAASDRSEVASNVIESWSMSWWGFQKGRTATMIIIETPDDAAYQFHHPAGGPTVIGPRWRATLGRYGSPRSARMCFVSDGSYVDLAKRYRRYAIDAGFFVSLRDKIAHTPSVGTLIGTPLTRVGILKNLKPESDRYDKSNPEKNYSLTTFEARAEQLLLLKQKGIDRLHVCLTGWPHLGYDRQHPDELPPPEQAGGWSGFKNLTEAARQLGYVLTLHDQYRDYYIDAPSYDPQLAIHEEDAGSPPHAFPGTRFGDFKEGDIPFMRHWDGGIQTFLNPRLMLGHLIKNYELLFDHGVRPDGIYLDVFGYVPPDEDFNPDRPTTRTESLAARAACYRWARNHLGIVGTEAGCDWTVPYVDVSSPLGPGKAVSVPLFNLVYHDAIITPYRMGDMESVLSGLLNGGLPQVGDLENELLKSSSRIRQMSALHQRVALLEMTKHEFLDATFRRERSTFSDGTVVVIDRDANSFSITPPLSSRN